MAKFEGFNQTQLTEVKKIYTESRVILEKIVKDFDSAQFRQRFKDWMGTASVSDLKSAEKSLQSSINVMFSRVATLSFCVTYDAGMSANGTNADMWGFTGADMSAQDVLTLADDYRSSNLSVVDAGITRVSGGALVMRLGSNLWTMPFKSLTEQSQVETFIHELSHHAAGTIDDKNGGECYGLTGVNRLKAAGPARAVRNAENVGFFCMSYG